MDGLTKTEKQKFIRLAPEFVIERKSPSDRSEVGRAGGNACPT
jgi:hypothetical protein